MYRQIIGLHPYSNTSHSDEHGHSYEYINHERVPVKWHLVLFDRWYNLGIYLPSKFQFSFSWVDDCFMFTRYWGKPNSDKDEEPYHYTVIRLPWRSEAFKQGLFYKDRWIDYSWRAEEYSLGNKKEKYFWDIAKLADKAYIFNAYGKKIIAQVRGERIWYAPKWFPLWLKELWNEKKEYLHIEFSDEIGKERGSWKGGTVGMATDWTGTVRDSWYSFKNGKLKEIINE